MSATAEPVPASSDDEVVEALVPRHDVPTGGRSGFVIIEGRQVHYLEWGRSDAPVVMCLHGGGQTAYMFEELGAALAGRHHVIAPDLPDHGDSDRLDLTALMVDGRLPPGSGPVAIAGSVPPLMDEFGVERAAFVGASLGGLTSLRLAESDPGLVGAIALIDVGHRLEPEGVRKIVDFLGAHESFASLEEAAEEISRYLPHRRNVRPESLTRNLRLRADGRWEWKHGIGRRFREMSSDNHPADNLDTVLAGVSEAARSIRCPALVLRGDSSDVLSQKGAEEVAALIPGAELVTVEKAGHLAAGDNPHSTVALISEFLSRQTW